MLARLVLEVSSLSDYQNNIFNKMKNKIAVLEKEGIEIEVEQINEITL